VPECQQGLTESESCDRVFTQGVASSEPNTQSTLYGCQAATKLNVRFMQSGIFEAGRKGLDNPHKSSSVSLSHK